MSPGDQRQAVDNILVYSRQAGGLPDTAVILQMFEDVEGPFCFDSQAGEYGAFSLGEALSAGFADQEANFPFFPRPSLLPDVPAVLLAIEGALGVLTTKVFEWAHGVLLSRPSTGTEQPE